MGVYFLITSVPISGVTLRNGAKTKKATAYKNDMTEFVFTFSTTIKCEDSNAYAEESGGGVVLYQKAILDSHRKNNCVRVPFY